eukprot:1139049-Pelagomonas_calceolata.AAC.11
MQETRPSPFPLRQLHVLAYAPPAHILQSPDPAPPTWVHLFLAAVLAASSSFVGVTPLRRRFTLQQGPSPMWGGAQSMQLVSTKGTSGASGFSTGTVLAGGTSLHWDHTPMALKPTETLLPRERALN